MASPSHAGLAAGVTVGAALVTEGFLQLFQKHWPGSRGSGPDRPSRAIKLLRDLGQIPSPFWASNSSLSDKGVRLEHVQVLGSTLRIIGQGQRGGGLNQWPPVPTAPLFFFYLSIFRKQLVLPAHQASSSVGTHDLHPLPTQAHITCVSHLPVLPLTPTSQGNLTAVNFRRATSKDIPPWQAGSWWDRGGHVLWDMRPPLALCWI